MPIQILSKIRNALQEYENSNRLAISGSLQSGLSWDHKIFSSYGPSPSSNFFVLTWIIQYFTCFQVIINILCVSGYQQNAVSKKEMILREIEHWHSFLNHHPSSLSISIKQKYSHPHKQWAAITKQQLEPFTNLPFIRFFQCASIL